MPPAWHQFHVITGGPGAGKSTLLDALADAGFAVVPESGRAIIREQRAVGGRAMPWADVERYVAMMVERDLANHRTWLSTGGPVYFDRGLPDIIAYLRLLGRKVPQALGQAATKFRYAQRVFLAPHWPAIYRQDEERKQSPNEAMRTCVALRALYTELGYEVIDLPLASVHDRLEFVLLQSSAQPLGPS